MLVYRSEVHWEHLNRKES